MAIDLDKISNELEDALERARLLAEQRQQAQITPLHMLYVLLDGESALAAMLERSGVAAAGLLETFATQLNTEKNAALEPGRRPTASKALRNLLEKSFIAMAHRGAERAEPIDFVVAAVEHGEEALKGGLRQAGVTKPAIDKAVDARQSTGETLGAPHGAGGPKPAAGGAACLKSTGAT